LINTLGGKRNIVDTSTTISTLKINVRDNSTLTKEKFDKFKITGFLKNTNQVILVFGDNAQAINEKLIKKL
jgi:phosphotransferase system IIB component